MDKAYKILEIDEIIKKIDKYIKTYKGRYLLENLEAIKDFDIVNSSLNRLKEFDEYISKYGDLPIFSTLDLYSLLSKVKKGDILSEEDLLKIKEEIENIIDLNKFFFKNKYEFNYLMPVIKDFSSPNDFYNLINNVIGKDGTIKDDASKKLYEIRNKKYKLNNELHKQISQSLSKYNEYLSQSNFTLKGGSYCLAISSSYKSFVKGIVKDISDSGLTTFITPFEVVDIENEIHIIELEENLEISKILRDLTIKFLSLEDVFKKNNNSIGELDLLTAKVKYKVEMNANIILPSKGKIIKLLDAKHPLLDQKVAVGNDFIMDKDHIQMIISGPNAGGKTIALKTVAILSYLEKMALPLNCSADSEISIFNHIYIDIGDNQSIESNLSTFSAHISNLSVIFKYLSSKDLVVIDEIGNGTDPKEGESLAIAVAKYLLNKECFSLITSHYDGVKKFGLSNENIINASFIFNEKKIQSTFKLMFGIGGKSYGFLIAKKYGIDSSIVSDAINIYNKKYLTKEEVRIKKIETKEISLKEKEVELNELKNNLKNKEEELNKLEISLKEKEEKLKNKKLDELDVYLDKKYDEINDIYEEFLVSKNKKDTDKKLDKVIEEENDEEEINVNDFVYIKSLDSKGKVISKNKDKIEVSLDNGVTIKTDVSKASKTVSVSSKKQLKNVDEMVLKFKTMPSSLNLIGYHIDEGIDSLIHYLDQCSLNKVHEVKVIHGYGSGKLREAIHAYLKKSPYVESFRLGNELDGGSGATIIKLK